MVDFIGESLQKNLESLRGIDPTKVRWNDKRLMKLVREILSEIEIDYGLNSPETTSTRLVFFPPSMPTASRRGGKPTMEQDEEIQRAFPDRLQRMIEVVQRLVDTRQKA